MVFMFKINNIVGGRTGKGKNPFDYVLMHNGQKMSGYAVCYDSPRLSSQAVCKDIAERMVELVESAVKVLKGNGKNNGYREKS